MVKYCQFYEREMVNILSHIFTPQLASGDTTLQEVRPVTRPVTLSKQLRMSNEVPDARVVKQRQSGVDSEENGLFHLQCVWSDCQKSSSRKALSK